ncbi:MAG: hypothetical protein ACR2K2_07110 [Mycobacteriales bacterium]
MYVPCGVHVTGGGTVPASIVAEGPIRLSGANVVVDPGVPGAPSLLTASTASEAVLVAGGDARLTGTVVAPDGGVSLAGARGIYRCGVLAGTVSVSGDGVRVPVDGCSAT